MKKTFFLLISLLILGNIAKAQITFEHSFNFSGIYTNLEEAGTKFYLMDWEAEQCRLYNSDYSLWKTVNFNIPTNQYLYDIKFVSQHLFNNDDLVEMVIIYRKYIATSTSYYYQYTTEVLNENGSVLLSVNGSSWIEVFSTLSKETKMILYVYDYSKWPYDVETRVYSIPGTLSGIPESKIAAQNTITAYPNPASTEINLRFSNPLVEEASLTIRDLTGAVILEKSLTNQLVEQQIDLLGLPNGTYTYQVVSQNLVLKPATFVIAR